MSSFCFAKLSSIPRRLQRAGQRVGVVRIEENRRTTPLAEALDDRHQLLHAHEAPLGLRGPHHNRKPLLPRSLDGAVQRDQIRHIEMADRDPVSVGLLQYLKQFSHRPPLHRGCEDNICPARRQRS
jgi:hypothetical protein